MNDKKYKSQIRSQILLKRNQQPASTLSYAKQALAEVALANQKLTKRLKQASYILSYNPFKGEIAPDALLKNLTAQIYLPKITCFDNATMSFHLASNTLMNNRYGIGEPEEGSPTKYIHEFDVVLVPLVAFDNQCNRIGMGAGFYDKALKDLSDLCTKPLLIGLAYQFQQVDSIKPDSWDEPLDVILTDHKIFDYSSA